MVLPLELVPYAENFYRRFPEEFVALGAPGLEEIYDLRPIGGTLTKKFSESLAERTVEITIRRWHHAPSWPSSLHAHGGHSAGQAVASSLTVAAATAAAEEQVSGRLARLEAAVTSLQPQIEALLMAQMSASRLAACTSATLGAGSIAQSGGLTAAKHNEETNKLQARRQISPLQIQTAPIGSDASKFASNSTVIKLDDGPTADNSKDVVKETTEDGIQEKEAKAGDRQRPRISVNPLRIAPAPQDPASPRSPGRYSAWKN
jgi:hypothetical protein